MKSDTALELAGMRDTHYRDATFGGSASIACIRYLVALEYDYSSRTYEPGSARPIQNMVSADMYILRTVALPHRRENPEENC